MRRGDCERGVRSKAELELISYADRLVRGGREWSCGRGCGERSDEDCSRASSEEGRQGDSIIRRDDAIEARWK